MYYIYNGKIYEGKVYETKKDEKLNEVMLKFHKPKSTSFQDYVWIYDLYTADSVEELKDKIVKWAISLNYKSKGNGK